MDELDTGLVGEVPRRHTDGKSEGVSVWMHGIGEDVCEWIVCVADNVNFVGPERTAVLRGRVKGRP